MGSIGSMHGDSFNAVNYFWFIRKMSTFKEMSQQAISMVMKSFLRFRQSLRKDLITILQFLDDLEKNYSLIFRMNLFL